MLLQELLRLGEGSYHGQAGQGLPKETQYWAFTDGLQAVQVSVGVHVELLHLPCEDEVSNDGHQHVRGASVDIEEGITYQLGYLHVHS